MLLRETDKVVLEKMIALLLCVFARVVEILKGCPSQLAPERGEFIAGKRRRRKRSRRKRKYRGRK